MFFTQKERQLIRKNAELRRISVRSIARMRKSLNKGKIVPKEPTHPSRVCEYTPEMHAIEMVAFMTKVFKEKKTAITAG